MKKILLMLCACLCVQAISAQEKQGDTIFIRKDKNGTLAQINFAPDTKLARTNKDEAKTLDALLSVRQGIDEYRLNTSKIDKQGHIHNKYNQYFKGVIVDHAQFIMHSTKSVESANGNIKQISEDFSVTPKINAPQALETALKEIGAEMYSWELPDSLNAVNPLLALRPIGQLVIAETGINGIDSIALAWKFQIVSIKPFTEQLIYIDAETGEVLKRINQFHTINAPGTGDTRYNGTKSIVTDTYSGKYRLAEIRNSVAMRTMNLNYGDGSPLSFSGATELTDTDNNWTVGEHGANTDIIGTHWAMEQALDYYNSIGISGFDGLGGSPVAYPHWNGGVNAGYSPAYNVLLFGPGGAYGAYYFNPMTSLHVVGHEGAHRYAYIEVNFADSKEPGAINEGMSDIHGVVMVHNKLPAINAWKIHVEGGTSAPLRDVSNPNASIVFPQPTTYNGTYYVATTGCTPTTGPSGNDNCGVHRNMSILTYAFYIMSVGKSGTNDIGNAFSVQGIGVNTAAAIAFRAEKFYMTSNTTFANARDNFIQAAKDLYGAGSCQEIAVTNAFYAVGVGTPYVMSGAMTTAPTSICTSATFSMTGIPAGATVTWSVVPSGSVTLSGTTGTSVTLTRIGGSNATINVSATISNACGGSTVVTKQARVGLVNDPVPLAVAHPVTCGWNIKGTVAPSATSYEASYNGGTTWVTCPQYYNSTLGAYEYYVYEDVPGPGTYSCKVRATNACGTTTAVTRSWTVAKRTGNCAARMANPNNGTDTTKENAKHISPLDKPQTDAVVSLKIYPNPTAQYITIQIPESSKTSDDQLRDIRVINVFDATGKCTQTVRFAAGTRKANIDLGNGPSGVYLVEISDNKNKHTRKILRQ